jgi:hypothetical protein
MRRWVVIIGTIAVVSFVGRLMHIAVKEQEHYWLLPMFLLAVVAFGYAMSEPHERQEFRAFGWLILSPAQWPAAWQRRKAP